MRLGTTANTRSNLHCKSQQARRFFDYGQTQTHTHSATTMSVNLIVLVEDAIQLVFGDADAGIADGNNQRVGCFKLASDRDFTFIGIFDGITYQVLQ